MMTNDTLTLPSTEQKFIVRKKLKTLFITLPQRDTPGTFVPYGPMAVMTYLKKAGYDDMHFYHMDLRRPSKEEGIQYIINFKPDVLCISAPVSTSYDNCKYFSLEIKKHLPGLTIVLGGNLAASAEIILHKTGVDYCVLGDGEIACKKLYDKLAEGASKEEMKKVPGLAFLDDSGKFINTHHAEQLGITEIYDVDWNFLDDFAVKHCFRKLGDLNPKSITFRFYFPDGKVPDPAMLDKKIGIIACSKGCVARCTFCHRFQKGIRFIPPEILLVRMQELMDRFNVGAFNFADECFGADFKWLEQFCKTIKPLNVIWLAGGMRVARMTPEIVAMMKDAGCRSIIYGMETGSDRILKIMEKRASLEDNSRAFKYTLGAGLYTIPQLVLGMPGETPETIEESAEFISNHMILDPLQNPREVSINFAQALPGTPLYEFARHKGFVGKSIEDEEQYLMHVSDRNACDEETTLNFTDYPLVIYLSWRNYILTILKYKYANAFGMEHYNKVMFQIFPNNTPPSLWECIRCKKLGLIMDRFPKATYHFRKALWILKLGDIYFKKGFKVGNSMLKELVIALVKRPWVKNKNFEYKSLRKIVDTELPDAYAGNPEMVPLRQGR